MPKPFVAIWDDDAAWINAIYYGSVLNPEYSAPNNFVISPFWTYSIGGTKYVYTDTNFNYPEGRDWGNLQPSNSSDDLATLGFYIACIDTFQKTEAYSVFKDQSLENSGYVVARQSSIRAGQRIEIGLSSSGEFSYNFDLFLPKILGTPGTTILYVGTKGETYYDQEYATLAQGYVGSFDISDTVAVADAKARTGFSYRNDLVTTYHNVRYGNNTIPWRFPIENVLVVDSINLFSYRIQAATSWIFTPTYRVLIDLNDTGDFATTNWHNRINNYSSIDKAQKHWSGKYETTEWSPEFVDENNELLGSMYSSGYDIRGKQIMLRAMITDRPLQWNTQFSGKIRSTKWQDGLLKIVANDELRDLVNRKFVPDYDCVGTIVNGVQYGIVKAVIGTSVMINDKGQISKIQRKTKQSPNYFNVAYNTALAGVNVAMGNYVGAGLNAINAGVELSKSGEKLQSAYIQVQDDNLIADDTIFSGDAVKFYREKIDGVAQNNRSPLYPLMEYTISGGTFINGIYGTLNIEDTTGINVGDFLYVKKPLTFIGNPNDVIRNILTGSNIDIPYDSGSYYTYVNENPVLQSIGYGDFNSNWNPEISIYGNLSLRKQVEFGSSPFAEIKEIAESCQLYFYIDGNDKFAISSIDGKDILQNASGIATYSDVYGNILKGFSYEQSSEDAYGKLIYKYSFSGKSNEFRRKQEFGKQVGQFNSFIKTIESKWIDNDDDAYVLGNRIFQKFGTGYERVSIPTTLYGLLNNVGDLIRVTHRTGSVNGKTFEIVAQSKDLQSNEISFEAEGVEYINNQGYCEWGTTFGTTTGTSKGGYSVVGRIANGYVGTMGTFYNPSGTYNAFDTNVIVASPVVVQEANRYVGIGSGAYGNFEVCAVLKTFKYPISQYNQLTLLRGLFNTVSRPICNGDTLYDLGQVQLKPGYNDITRESVVPGNIFGVRFATTNEINSLIGTSFKFF